MMTAAQILLNSLCLALVFATIAFTISVVLIEPGMFLFGFYKFLRYGLRLTRYPWLFKPLIDCDRCHSGQWALWGYLIFNWPFPSIGSVIHCHIERYSILGHLFCISASILLVSTLTILYRKWKNQ